jgi:CubicO group peptidase (beta-lactamase class C family)
MRGALLRGLATQLALAALLWAPPAAPSWARELVSAPAESLGFSSARLERLDAWMEGRVAAHRKAGAVVLIARHGKIAWEKAYGVADLASGRPMRTDAMFRLFSMTKPVTAVAALTLYEQGKFQLTDPLDRYLPDFAKVRVYAGLDPAGKMILEAPKRAITLQDVFRHTAGFTYGGFFDNTPVDKAYQAAGVPAAQSLAELVGRMSGLPLLYQPGERWVYSFSYDVLAYLVEQLSGMSFDQYCRKVIFAPLGMKDTVFGIPPELASRFPTLYTRDPGGELKPVAAADDLYTRLTGHPGGGVGLSSTARDYLRFAQMLLDGGELDGVRILSPATVALMTSDNLPPGTAYWHDGMRYGLGVSVVTDPAQAGNIGSKGQFGWPGLASTWFTVDPKQDLVALVLVQDLPRDIPFDDEFQTLVYQALVK